MDRVDIAASIRLGDLIVVTAQSPRLHFPLEPVVVGQGGALGLGEVFCFLQHQFVRKCDIELPSCRHLDLRHLGCCHAMACV